MRKQDTTSRARDARWADAQAWAAADSRYMVSDDRRPWGANRQGPPSEFSTTAKLGIAQQGGVGAQPCQGRGRRGELLRTGERSPLFVAWMSCAPGPIPCAI